MVDTGFANASLCVVLLTKILCILIGGDCQLFEKVSSDLIIIEFC